MRANVVAGERYPAPHMFQHGSRFKRLFGLILVVKRDFLVQKREIAGFLEIGAHRQDDPQVIVAVILRAFRIFVRVAHRRFHAQRVELVHRVPGAHLGMQQLGDQRFGLVRHVRDHAHDILRAVAETDSA